MIFALVAGCSHGPDKPALKSAIDSYYSTQNECVWAHPAEFPLQVHTAHDTETYDALTNAGLLNRATHHEDLRFLGPQQMNDYELTSKGRSEWTPDPEQSGHGNFCFGHRQVTTIDKVAARKQGGVTTAVVSYHYGLTGVPDWAKSDEIQAAFPDIKADLSGSSSSAANLEKGPDGWQVKPAS
jgi:hypothetical protein